MRILMVRKHNLFEPEKLWVYVPPYDIHGQLLFKGRNHRQPCSRTIMRVKIPYLSLLAGHEVSLNKTPSMMFMLETKFVLQEDRQMNRLHHKFLPLRATSARVSNFLRSQQQKYHCSYGSLFPG